MTLRDGRRPSRSAPAWRRSHLAALSVGLLSGVAAGWFAGLVRVRKP